MERNVKWKIGITRTLTRVVEVTAESEDEAIRLAKSKYGKAPLSTFDDKGEPELSVKECSKMEWSPLDKLMVPNAMFNGGIVTARILEAINKGTRNTAIPKDLIKKALATGAYWFRTRKGNDHRINKLDPVKSMADAKSMGFKPYRIPAFPKKYAGKRKTIVGNQNFTYEELYEAWKGAMERTINSRENVDLWCPCYLDLRSNPDDQAGEILCAADDIESLCDQMTEYPREISATYVTFYSNDIVTDTAYDEESFHIENGELD